MTQDYEFDIEYVEANVFEREHDVYAYAKYHNMPKCLPNTYSIVCNNLPKGSYTLEGKHINLHFNTLYMLASTEKNFMDIRYNENNSFNFIIKRPCDRFLLQVKKCNYKDIERIVKDLRRQAFLNQKQLEQDSNLSL